MKRIVPAGTGLLLVILPLLSLAQCRTWEVGVAGGAVYNFRTPLRIEQADAALIRVRASYSTEPFTPPVYYNVRLSTWKKKACWELKFTHHKLILENKPPEVQRFSITDGFNLLTINRLWQLKGLSLSAGGGVVITHPESTIRNRPFPENRGILGQGYYVSGPTVETAVTKRFHFSDRWFAFIEGRVSASYVHVPVVAGHARVTNVASHLLIGTGIKLNRKEAKSEHSSP